MYVCMYMKRLRENKNQSIHILTVSLSFSETHTHTHMRTHTHTSAKLNTQNALGKRFIMGEKKQHPCRILIPQNTFCIQVYKAQTGQTNLPETGDNLCDGRVIIRQGSTFVNKFRFVLYEEHIYHVPCICKIC